jgi:tetratricopeptide (TPR) repeat protein
MLIDSLLKYSPAIQKEKIKSDSLQRVINEMHADKKNELISAIAGTWPFLLCVFAIIISTVLFIFYRRKIAVGLSKFNVVKGGIGAASIELSNSHLPSVDNSPVANDGQSANIITEEALPRVTTVNATEENHKPSFYKVYTLLKKGKKEEAEAVLESFQREVDSIDKREQNLIFFHSLAYDNGYLESLEELRKILSISGIIASKISALRAISRIYNRNSQFEKSISASQEAIKLSNNSDHQEQISQIILEMFEPYKSLSRQNDYLQIIFGHIKVEDSDIQLSKLYQRTAETYKSLEMLYEESIFLVKANEYVGNDTSLIFQTAYALHNIEQTELAIHYYEITERINGKQDYVLNNLGVAYDAVDMPSLSYEKFQQSFLMGNSLAASNIANRYIKIGMIQTAREILDQSKDNGGEIHPNVWNSYNSIDALKQKADKKVIQIKNEAIQINRFYRRTAEIVHGNQNFSFDLTLCNSIEPTIKNIESAGSNSLKFVHKSKDFIILLIGNNNGYGKCTAESKRVFQQLCQ